VRGGKKEVEFFEERGGKKGPRGGPSVGKKRRKRKKKGVISHKLQKRRGEVA